jgi:hypothetical protein
MITETPHTNINLTQPSEKQLNTKYIIPIVTVHRIRHLNIPCNQKSIKENCLILYFNIHEFVNRTKTLTIPLHMYAIFGEDPRNKKQYIIGTANHIIVPEIKLIR